MSKIQALTKISVTALLFFFQTGAAIAAPDCSKMPFIKPLPFANDKTDIESWNLFVKQLDGDHQTAVNDQGNNDEISEYVQSQSEKSDFNRSLYGLAEYHGCFGFSKNRNLAIQKLEISANAGEPLAIIYLSRLLVCH